MGLSLSFQVSFFLAALSSSFNKSFLLIASPSFSFKLVRFRCGSFPVVPSLLFFVAALSANFNKSFLLIASPSFSFKLVRFRCGSFPVVPSAGYPRKMWKSFRGLAAENVEKFPWVSRGKCGKVSVGGCQAATCGHSSGCKRLQVAAGDKRMLAATCGHLRPLEWLQVAAISKIKLRASCVLNASY